MASIALRKIKLSDREYFAQWWRDRELLKLTSGILQRITDQEVDRYFQAIVDSEDDYNFIITINKNAIGHICLAKRRNDWYETQIVIGERKYQGMGYGSEAIKLLMRKAERLKISKIYLEVRPTNKRAIRAYEKCGFQKVKIVSYPKNKYLQKVVRMELKK